MSSMADKSAIRQTLDAVVHSWGFVGRPKRLTSELLWNLTDRYKILGVTIDDIEVDQDATSRVKFQIDPARGNGSRVHSLYEGQGDVAQIKLILPFENQGYWVKLYPDGVMGLDDEKLSEDKIRAFSYHVLKEVFGM